MKFNIDICRKCLNWNEFLCLDHHLVPPGFECCARLGCEKNRGVKLCITLPNADMKAVRGFLNHRLFGSKLHCHEPAYQLALKHCDNGDMNELFRKEMCRCEIPDDCDCMAEYMMEEWNG